MKSGEVAGNPQGRAFARDCAGTVDATAAAAAATEQAESRIRRTASYGARPCGRLWRERSETGTFPSRTRDGFAATLKSGGRALQRPGATRARGSGGRAAGVDRDAVH